MAQPPRHPENRRPLTLRDVSEACGVSEMTVSRVLRNREDVSPATREKVLAAARILIALDYVGVIGVEFFVTEAGLVVNEIAPRVHNSGHWTQNGCAVDQFEQHIRAIAGWPLGDGGRHADVVMENLIGTEANAWPQLARASGTALHLYGKAEARPGRKMGHVNRVTPRR